MGVDLTLSDADKARISAAVTAAELKSSGEIVTIVAPRSDGYADIAQDWAIFIAFLGFAIYVTFEPFYQHLLGWVMGGWDMPSPHAQLIILFIAVLIKYLGTLLLLQWKPLRLLVTPRFIKRHRVRAQALTAFKVATQQRTVGGTGLLIYLSEEERMAEIIAEAGLHSKVDDTVWGEAMMALIADVRKGRVADGMIAAITLVGDILAAHFPRDPGDVNELPDRVIEL